MKLSVSLPDEDVAFLDAFARSQGFQSRSAVVQRAVNLLRVAELGSDYEAAWAEWVATDDAHLWERTVGDGLTD